MRVRATDFRQHSTYRLPSTSEGGQISMRALPDKSWTARLAASLRCWWVAYVTWRINRSALAQLAAMSDRDLRDIGLTRGEIENTVWDGAAMGCASRRNR